MPPKDKKPDEFAEFFDRLAAGFAAAVDDIRHKVVEEPWFGREVTGNLELSGIDISPAAPTEIQDPMALHREQFDAFWGNVEKAKAEYEKGIEPPDQGIDR